MTLLAVAHAQNISKMATAYRFSFFAIATLLLFTLFNMKYEFYTIAAAELLAASLWALIIQLHQKNYIADAVVYHSMIMLGFVVFHVLFCFGGYGNAGVFWMLGFPFLAYFFAGSRLGTYWCAAYIATFFIFEGLASLQVMQLPYPSETISLIPVTLFVFAALAYFYEADREAALRSEHQALHSLQQEMKQHQQDEQALILSQERIKAMMADMREAMFQLNIEGKVRLISPSIEQITHYTPEQLLQMNLTDLFSHAEDKDKFHKEIHHYGQVRNFHVELKAANLQRVFVSINARLSYDDNRSIVGIEGIVSDITQVKQSENSMHLLINQLRTARDAARASSQEKTNFLSLVSHELRTPIHGLMGMQEMLMMDASKLTKEQQDYLYASQQATVAISHLIHDMLLVGDAAANQHKAEPSHIELAPFLCEVMNHHSYLVKEKGLAYQLQLHQAPSALTTDVAKLRQVIFNLLSYAIKQATYGQVCLKVQVLRGRLQFEVAYQATPAQGASNRTSGATVDLEALKESSLEMSLIYGCLEALDAVLHSTHHTTHHTLILEMPMLSPHPQCLNLRLEGNDLSQIHIFGQQKSVKISSDKPEAHILLAEDDKISRMIAVKRLKRAGFDVMAVNDGQQAWQALQHAHFDVLLTDIRMPILDGLALTKKIRQQEQSTGQHLHILGLSAHAMPEHIATFLKAGMDDFLSKPLEPSQLLLHIPSNKPQAVVQKC